jgi:hypothetical protein
MSIEKIKSLHPRAPHLTRNLLVSLRPLPKTVHITHTQAINTTNAARRLPAAAVFPYGISNFE